MDKCKFCNKEIRNYSLRKFCNDCAKKLELLGINLSDAEEILETAEVRKRILSSRVRK